MRERERERVEKITYRVDVQRTTRRKKTEQPGHTKEVNHSAQAGGVRARLICHFVTAFRLALTSRWHMRMSSKNPSSQPRSGLPSRLPCSSGRKKQQTSASDQTQVNRSTAFIPPSLLRFVSQQTTTQSIGMPPSFEDSLPCSAETHASNLALSIPLCEAEPSKTQDSSSPRPIAYLENVGLHFAVFHLRVGQGAVADNLPQENTIGPDIARLREDLIRWKEKSVVSRSTCPLWQSQTNKRNTESQAVISAIICNILSPTYVPCWSASQAPSSEWAISLSCAACTCPFQHRVCVSMRNGNMEYIRNAASVITPRSVTRVARKIALPLGLRCLPGQNRPP